MASGSPPDKNPTRRLTGSGFLMRPDSTFVCLLCEVRDSIELVRRPRIISSNSPFEFSALLPIPTLKSDYVLISFQVRSSEVRAFTSPRAAVLLLLFSFLRCPFGRAGMFCAAGCSPSSGHAKTNVAMLIVKCGLGAKITGCLVEGRYTI